MTEPAFDRIDTLSSLFEASDNLGYVVGVLVAKAELAILIVFTNSVDMSL